MIPVVLTIGALDPLGADGLLADARSFSALGVHGAAAVSMVGEPAEPLDPEQVGRQIAVALAATAVAAVKVGALGSAAMVRRVAEALAGCSAPVVADPSFARREGAAPDAALVDAWRDALLPHTTAITPNLVEAALLSGTGRATTLGEMRQQGEALVALGCSFAVVSGGHGQSASSIDIMVTQGHPAFEMRGERLERRSMRGLSATFAAAIAAHLAHGMRPNEAISHAKLFVSTAIGAADNHGTYDGPQQMHRMWRRRQNERDKAPEE